jgi:hypothetical protein
LGLEGEVFGFCAGFVLGFSSGRGRGFHRSFYTRVWRVGVFRGTVGVLGLRLNLFSYAGAAPGRR